MSYDSLFCSAAASLKLIVQCEAARMELHNIFGTKGEMDEEDPKMKTIVLYGPA